MTCIIGLEGKDCVYMAGDSGAVDDFSTTAITDEKVYQITCREGSSEFLIGYEGSFRMGQVVKYKFHPPRHYIEIPDHEYLCTVFVQELIECLEENQVLKRDFDETIQTDRMLLGYNGKLYAIDSDFNVLRNRMGFDTIGSGFEIARGAMGSNRNSKMKPEERLTSALEIVGEMCNSVTSPYYVKKLEGSSLDDV